MISYETSGSVITFWIFLPRTSSLESVGKGQAVCRGTGFTGRRSPMCLGVPGFLIRPRKQAPTRGKGYPSQVCGLGASVAGGPAPAEALG